MGQNILWPITYADTVWQATSLRQVQYRNVLDVNKKHWQTTRSSADADNRRDAFSGQSIEVNKHGTILGPLRLFAKHVTGTTRHKSLSYRYVIFVLAVCCSSDAAGYTFTPLSN